MLNINRNIKICLFTFFVITGFLFVRIEKADAGWQCVCAGEWIWSQNTIINITCDNNNTDNCQNVCSQQCKNKGYSSGLYSTTIVGDSVLSPHKSEDDCPWASHPIVCLLRAILKVMGYLLSAGATLVIWIMDVKNIAITVSNPITYEIWVNVRDVLNIAFILGLLFIAFCTVFQIDKFSYKRLLLTLIIMALLVNFSFPIARVIIDFSNVIMYYFLNAMGFAGSDGGTFSKLVKGSPLDNIINNPGSDISYLITAIIFTFIFAVTLLILGILFVIRLSALTFLIIFSPIAFVGSIIPFLSKHASSWWDNLFKYSFFGPIMVFMLWVSIKFIEAAKNFQTSASGASMVKIAGTQSVEPGLIAALAFFSVPIVILWMGMGVAQSMSIAGASAVVGRGQKFLNWSGKTFSGYRTAKWYGKELKKDHLDPWVQAWKTRRNEKKQDKRDMRMAARRDLIGKIFDGGKRDPEFYRNAKKAELVAKYKKEQESVSTQDSYCWQGIKKLQGKKDMESQLRTQAFFMTMSDQNDLNEFRKLQGKDTDPYATKWDVVKTMKNNGMSEDEIGRTLLHLGNNSFAKGAYSFGGWGTFDDLEVDPETHERLKDEKGNYLHTGKFRHRIMSDEEQKEWVLGKVKNIELQKLMINMHPDSLITENSNGSAKTVHDIGHSIISMLESTGMKHLNRMRVDTLTKIHQVNDVIKDTGHTDFAAELDKAVIVKTAGTNETKEKEPVIEIAGGSHSSRGKTTFDSSGKPQS